MSITATVYVEHDRLALVPTLRSLGDIDIRVVAQGTTDPGTTVFPFFVEYDDRRELEAALAEDPTVDEYDLVEWGPPGGIYYIEHTEETKLVSTVVTDVNGFLIHTETRNSGWVVRLLLPDKQALNAVWEYTVDHGISLDIVEVYGNDDVEPGGSYGLTDEQRSALRLAYEHGYFSEPRDASLEELAAELGLSSTAMSGRLRRGMRNLVATTVADDENDPGDAFVPR